MAPGSDAVHRYHDGTKHHFNRFARSPGYLDWASQPRPFRRFADAPAFALPPRPDASGRARTIGDLLRHSLGLSAWKRFRETRWSLRVNPSSGNLHPTEAYVVGRVAETPRLSVGDLEMDLVTRKVTRNAQLVELTVREFELLEYLLRYHGQVVSRETLARDVWKETARTTPLDNVIDVHIARLRRKVDLEQPIKLIHTVRGVGFMLREGEP